MSVAEQLEMFLWVLLAMGLGGVVGLEREIRGHEAGVRTNALVCAGAAIFGQISAAVDDTRIAAGVVQGIGFLGAGLVFTRGTNVHGITTAATIWVMAAIGLLIGGAELWFLPMLLTGTLIVLLEMAPGSDAVLRFSRSHGLAHGDAKPSDEKEDEGEEAEETAQSKRRQ